MQLDFVGLTRTYGSNVALNSLNLTLKKGIYGILGPNGAGKSTLMNLITDNLKRSSGNILYDGTDILKLGRKFRKKLGYMPQQQGYYEDLSAGTFLKYMAEVKGVPGRKAAGQIPELLERVHLSDVAHERVGSFSGGMKQRIMLAQALLGEPEILILDEPTAGLDPKERIRLRNFIMELSADKMILLATHVVSDIECIADKVLLMREGNLVGQGTPVELISSLKGKVAEKPCTKQQLSELEREYPSGNVSQRRDGMVFRLVGDEFPEGFEVIEDPIGLEDVYLYYCDS